MSGDWGYCCMGTGGVLVSGELFDGFLYCGKSWSGAVRLMGVTLGFSCLTACYTALKRVISRAEVRGS